MSALHLKLLGAFCVHDSAGREIRIASRKGRALLAYLALHAGESQQRERLANLLWEDVDDELARTSLRQALAALRKALPATAQPALIATPESVGMDAALIDSDLLVFRRSLALGTRTALQEAAAHYRGDLLDGLDARSTAFEEWLSTERIVLRKQFSEVLQTLTQLCTANDDADGALSASTRLVALEPLNEAAHRTLMDLHARRNAYAEALRQYRVCRDILRRELDIAPEPATEQLYRELMRKRRAAVAVVGPDEASADEPITAREDSAATAPSIAAGGEPELRDATILVARLEGLLELEAQLDPEESHKLSVEFHSRVTSAVAELGGRTDRRVGSNVLGAFGIPKAQGNEAERAVRAALALRGSVERKPWSVPGTLRLRFGIAEGQILCGAELFPLSGQPVHVAHTLAARAADSEILISKELRHSLGERLSVRRPAKVLHASAQPIAAWAVESLQSDHTGPGQPFVGRRPELAMIIAALERCIASRRGRTILVRGEAGIGKTRLADAVRIEAHSRGVAAHCAQVFDFGQSPGRRPITTLALSLLGMSADASADERRAAVRRLTGEQGGHVDQVISLSDLIDAPLATELTALEKAMDIATRQRGRALALARIIESTAARAPQLFIVEDVHWADADELGRLGEIAAVVAGCRILFIMTTRPQGDPISAAWRARARDCPVTTLDLAPLAEDEAHELATHYPGLAPETVHACIRRAGGYPLFLDQLLRAASAGLDMLPVSVRSLVLMRAGQLAGEDRLAAQAAAILGQRAALEPLRHMLGNPEYEPTRLVEAALARFEGAELEFAHALFRDAIHESTLKSRRRELHRAAAQWYATRDAVLYADHLAAAQDERAAEAYVKAAGAEQSALRFERALELATKAGTLAREPVMLHKTSVLLGELLLQLGRTHDALAAYREALDFANDQAEHGQAWFGIAAALRVMDRHDEALDALGRAEAALGEGADLQMRARICTLRGNLCFPLGRLDACLEAHQQAHGLASRANSPIDIARALGGLGDAYYQRGRMLTAREHFAQCTRQAREHHLVGVLLAYLPMLAVTYTYCGDPVAGHESVRESIELARRIGDVRGELIAHVTMASALLVEGATDECRARARQALDLATQLDARRFQAECLGIIAATLPEAEREEALRLAEQALQLARDTALSYCGPVLLSTVARLTTDPARRADALAEGESLLAAGCVSHNYFDFYGNAIDVSLREGAWQDARRYAAALETYTSEEPLPLMTLLVRRARLLAEVGEDRAGAATRAALQSLRLDCQRMNTLLALPAIDAVLKKKPEPD